MKTTLVTLAAVAAVTNAMNGEEACENRGLDPQSCEQVGCCHFNPQLGCMSSVGRNQCHDSADPSMPGGKKGMKGKKGKKGGMNAIDQAIRNGNTDSMMDNPMSQTDKKSKKGKGNKGKGKKGRKSKKNKANYSEMNMDSNKIYGDMDGYNMGSGSGGMSGSGDMDGEMYPMDGDMDGYNMGSGYGGMSGSGDMGSGYGGMSGHGDMDGKMYPMDGDMDGYNLGSGYGGMSGSDDMGSGYPMYGDMDGMYGDMDGKMGSGYPMYGDMDGKMGIYDEMDGQMYPMDGEFDADMTMEGDMTMDGEMSKKDARQAERRAQRQSREQAERKSMRTMDGDVLVQSAGPMDGPSHQDLKDLATLVEEEIMRTTDIDAVLAETGLTEDELTEFGSDVIVDLLAGLPEDKFNQILDDIMQTREDTPAERRRSSNNPFTIDAINGIVGNVLGDIMTRSRSGPNFSVFGR